LRQAILKSETWGLCPEACGGGLVEGDRMQELMPEQGKTNKV
jgi:hypothetical protein